MVYTAVRPFASWSLGHYFKRIDIANAERIPKNAAVILAANHPTTFVEPCVLACYLKDPLHFLVRGDFFKNPIASALLKSVNLIPVYRRQDAGYEGVKSNFKAFERSSELLAQRKLLMILAEGRCIHEKRLRPIQKGPARIALQALANTDLEEVYVVPVGCNFRYPDRVQSDIMISFGEPIKTSVYREQFAEAPAVAIGAFTKELERRMAQEVIIIDELDDELLTEHFHQLYRSENATQHLTGWGTDHAHFAAEKTIANTVNALSETEKKPLREQCYQYFTRLARMRTTDAAFKGNYKKESRQTAFVLLGLIPAVLLAILHLPLLFFIQHFSGVKVKTVEFANPVRWAGMLIGYLLTAIICLVLAAILWSPWPVLWITLTIGGIPFLVRYHRVATRWLLHWRMRRQADHEVKYLRAIRKELVATGKQWWTPKNG
ncbi:MAG: 1-acyl-sn-glycerol-3-phosphate acyltransferase [Bacteroidota bacterium]